NFGFILHLIRLHRRFLAVLPLLVVLGAAVFSGCSGERPQRVAAAPPPPPPIEFVSMWGMHGTDPGQLDKPVGLAMDLDSRAYIADPEANFMEKFTVAGVPLLTFEDHAVHGAAAVGVDTGGGIYVADPRAGMMHLFWPEGDLLRNFSIAPQRE